MTKEEALHKQVDILWGVISEFAKYEDDEYISELSIRAMDACVQLGVDAENLTTHIKIS